MSNDTKKTTEQIANEAKARVAQALAEGKNAVELTDEEIDAAKEMYLKKIADDKASEAALKAALTPRDPSQLTTVKLKADYWPTPQQVVDNRGVVAEEFAILPAPNPDPLGVDVTGEPRFKKGAIIALDFETALKLVGDQKAERADPFTSRAA